MKGRASKRTMTKPGMTAVAIHSIFPSSGICPKMARNLNRNRKYHSGLGTKAESLGSAFGSPGTPTKVARRIRTIKIARETSTSLNMLSGQKRSPFWRAILYFSWTFFFCSSFMSALLLVVFARKC